MLHYSGGCISLVHCSGIQMSLVPIPGKYAFTTTEPQDPVYYVNVQWEMQSEHGSKWSLCFANCIYIVVFKPPATSVREDVGRARQLFWSTLMNHQGGGGCCLLYCSVQISAQIRPQSRDRKGNSHCLQCKGKEIPRMQFLRIGEGEGLQHVVVTRFFFFFLHCRSMICLCTVAECTGFVRRSI